MKWLRWEGGRQQSGYQKLLLGGFPWLLPFDLYLLRFPEGSEIPPHTDPVDGRRHFRLNVVVRRARSGGEFVCAAPIFETPRIKLFRPDACEHSVTKVQQGTRYVLSLGWTLG